MRYEELESDMNEMVSRFVTEVKTNPFGNNFITNGVLFSQMSNYLFASNMICILAQVYYEVGEERKDDIRMIISELARRFMYNEVTNVMQELHLLARKSNVIESQLAKLIIADLFTSNSCEDRQLRDSDLKWWVAAIVHELSSDNRLYPMLCITDSVVRDYAMKEYEHVSI